MALGGLIAGLAVAFAVEHYLRLRREVRRLQNIEATLKTEREQHAELRRLLEYEATLAKRESAHNAVALEVFGGAFNEAAKTGHILPLSAILARIEVLQKAKGIDQPLPPPS